MSSDSECSFAETLCFSHRRDSQDGVDGADGQDGIDGADGQDGAEPRGCRGSRGLDGYTGQDGVDGTDGNYGQQGQDGVQDIARQDGQDGIDGEDGIVVAQGEVPEAARQDGQDGTDGEDGIRVAQGEVPEAEAARQDQDGTDGEDGISGAPEHRGSRYAGAIAEAILQELMTRDEWIVEAMLRERVRNPEDPVSEDPQHWIEAAHTLRGGRGRVDGNYNDGMNRARRSLVTWEWPPRGAHGLVVNGNGTLDLTWYMVPTPQETEERFAWFQELEGLARAGR